MISAPASQGAGALSSGLPPTRAFPAATLFLIDARVLNRLPRRVIAVTLGRTNDELVELATAAADRGELALLDMLRREAQRRGDTTTRITVDQAIETAAMPWDADKLATIDAELTAAATRLDAARRFVAAPPRTEEATSARLMMQVAETTHALAQFRAEHPDAAPAAVQAHEREHRAERDAAHTAQVNRVVQRFVGNLPQGLNVPPSAPPA